MITTDNKTLVQVINEVLRKLIAQGSQCVNNDGSCAYGNAQGQHCAVGWLLPENRVDLMEYEAGLQNLLSTDIKNNLGPNTQFLCTHSKPLTRLQLFHDNAHRAHTVSDSSRHILERLGVDPSLLNDFVSLARNSKGTLK